MHTSYFSSKSKPVSQIICITKEQWQQKETKIYKHLLHFLLIHRFSKNVFIKASILLTYSSKYIEIITGRILVEFKDFVSTMFAHQETPLSKINTSLFIG